MLISVSKKIDGLKFNGLSVFELRNLIAHGREDAADIIQSGFYEYMFDQIIGSEDSMLKNFSAIQI